MIKRITPLAIVAATLLAPPLWAADGTLQFSGKLRENTCILDASSRDQTVDMGTVPPIGGAIGTASIRIQLNNCPTSSDKVKVRFEGTPATDAIGRFADKTFAFSNTGQPGAAKNVGFVISGGGSSISWDTLVPVNGETQTFTLLTGPGTTNQLLFPVGHIWLNESVVGEPGTAVGNVQFSVDYP